MLIFGMMLLVALSAPAASAEPPAEARNEAAVIAADNAWDAAEERGDSNYVIWLLAPEYVSVGSDGIVHSKAMIVESARVRKIADPAVRSAKVAAWRVAHPSRMTVRLFGDTAVLSFVSTRPGARGAINSSDVFVYRNQRWHPVYSQHTSAGA